jgi:cytochrome P450
MTAETTAQDGIADGALPKPLPLPGYRPVRPPRLNAALVRFLTSPPQRLLAIVRWLWPILRVFRWAVVLRHPDVAEVLRRHDVFRVPFGDEIARLNDGETPGTSFLLGVDDDGVHGDQARELMAIFKVADLAQIALTSHATAAVKLRGAASHEIEAIHDLLTAVPVELCREYYGVAVERDEERRFVYATLELSGHLFGLPPIKRSKARHEDAAGKYVRAIVDRAIDRSVAERGGGRARDTIVDRLVDAPVEGADSAGAPGPDRRKRIRAILIGMIVGFVPTNTMASGHILEVLLSTPDAMRKSLVAAETGDDDGLMRCLFEALRYMPINLGPWRICGQDYRVAPETPRAKTLPKGTIVLAMTSSAMFDGQQVVQPFRFDPSRPASNYMHFGFGMHWCLGAMIARTQITHTFKALLERPAIERARRDGSLALWGLFPDRLRIRFDVKGKRKNG